MSNGNPNTEYLNKFFFRYNLHNDDNGGGFTTLFTNCEGRITHKGLVAHEA
jgi:hypothetical protein